MVPLTNRVKVRIYVYGLTIEIKDFAFEFNAILDLESTLLGGWVARICETITRVHKTKKKGSSFGTRPILNYIKYRPRLVRIDID